MTAPNDESLIPTVLVAVVTRRRPRQLARVLDVLLAQVTQQSCVDATVVVIDNDVAGSARAVTESPGREQVLYVRCPVNGIAAARNAALEQSWRRDAVVFVDDDDVPGAGWFDRLVGLWLDSGCDGVAGPLRSVVESQDPWVQHSGVFDRRTRPTGSRVSGAATNNLLLATAALRSRGLCFDESLGAAGGEDALLTHQLTASGAELLWCDEAEVVSPVAEERRTRRWVALRLLRSGGSWSQMELRMTSGSAERLRTRATLLARAGIRGPISLVSAVGWLALGSMPRAIRSCGRTTSYVGLFLGALGWVYQEYRVVDDDDLPRPDREPRSRQLRPDSSNDDERPGDPAPSYSSRGES